MRNTKPELSLTLLLQEDETVRPVEAFWTRRGKPRPAVTSEPAALASAAAANRETLVEPQRLLCPWFCSPAAQAKPASGIRCQGLVQTKEANERLPVRGMSDRSQQLESDFSNDPTQKERIKP